MKVNYYTQPVVGVGAFSGTFLLVDSIVSLGSMINIRMLHPLAQPDGTRGVLYEPKTVNPLGSHTRWNEAHHRRLLGDLCLGGFESLLTERVSITHMPGTSVATTLVVGNYAGKRTCFMPNGWVWYAQRTEKDSYPMYRSSTITYRGDGHARVRVVECKFPTKLTKETTITVTANYREFYLTKAGTLAVYNRRDTQTITSSQRIDPLNPSFPHVQIPVFEEPPWYLDETSRGTQTATWYDFSVKESDLNDWTFSPQSLVATDYYTPRSSVWNELSYDIGEQLPDFAGNLPAYISDIVGILDDIREVRRILKGKIDSKAMAKLYLSWHYGFSLSIQDTKALVKAAIDAVYNKRQQVHASFRDRVDTRIGVLEVTYSQSLVFEKDPDLGWMSDLLMWDVFGLGNAWDMIPFSFVIDWFTNFGDHFEAYDIGLLYDTLRVVLCCQSTTADLVIDNPTRFLGSSLPITGELRLRNFDRVICDTMPFPLSRVDDGRPFNHWFESAALIRVLMKDTKH